MKILITGANGFVGLPLSQHLMSAGHQIVGAVRSHDLVSKDNAQIDLKVIGEINQNTDWQECLIGVDCVIHLANRAHVIDEQSSNPLDLYRKVNVAGTLHLARQAASAGVRRFIFLSSIGVNGAETFAKSFSSTDIPKPHSHYAVSKYEAEIGLKSLAAKSEMEVVIIRPPLIYGPNAPGNFGSLLSLLHKKLPLPLGGIRNKRSFVALDNLIDLIVQCIENPAAANNIFLVSDGEDLSTTDFLYRMGSAMGLKVRLVPIPMVLVRGCITLIGKSNLGQSLCGSLQVDMSETLRLLNWSPPISVDEGLRRAMSK